MRLADDTEYAAKVVGKDAATDVALIKINAPPKNLPTVALGDSDAPPAGRLRAGHRQPVRPPRDRHPGHRLGQAPRPASGQGGRYDDFLQTDAAINPGNSGGPLFNLRGEVVGINTAIVSPQIGSGIGFAVPINLAKSLLPQLKAKGRVVRGYMGVAVSELTPDLAQAFGLPAGTKGALVQNVAPKRPAAKAGLEPGDLITSLNGKPVESSGDAHPAGGPGAARREGGRSSCCARGARRPSPSRWRSAPTTWCGPTATSRRRRAARSPSPPSSA